MQRKIFRFLILSIACFVTLPITDFSVGSANASGNRRLLRAQAQPRILKASLKGKKLMITGENFSADAVILVNEVAQKTNNDVDSPTTLLIAPKAGKKFSRNEIINVQ